MNSVVSWGPDRCNCGIYKYNIDVWLELIKFDEDQSIADGWLVISNIAISLTHVCTRCKLNGVLSHSPVL